MKVCLSENENFVGLVCKNYADDDLCDIQKENVCILLYKYKYKYVFYYDIKKTKSTPYLHSSAN